MDCSENLVHMIITCFYWPYAPPFCNHFLWYAKADRASYDLFYPTVIPISRKFCARLRLYLHLNKYECIYIWHIFFFSVPHNPYRELAKNTILGLTAVLTLISFTY